MEKLLSAVGSLNSTIAAALIAGVVAVSIAILGAVGYLIREFFLEPRKKRLQAERDLISERLTKVYSPLVSYVGNAGIENSRVLGQMDKDLECSIKENLHLLSSRQRDLFTELFLLGKYDGKQMQYTRDDLLKQMEIQEELYPIIIDEYEDLISKYSYKSKKLSSER